MRIGNYKINLDQIDKKVWFSIAGVVLLIIFIIFFWPREEEKPVYANPAPGLETTVVQNELDPEGEWIEPYIAYYGIANPTSTADFVNLERNVGIPFRFRIYLPPDDISEHPDLNVNQFGWQFTSGYFIPPNIALTPETSLDDIVGSNALPIQLGFAPGKKQSPGQAYQVEGILWWQSRGVNPKITDPRAPVSPTVLVSSAQKLSLSELQAPADYVALLNQSYKQYPYIVSLRQIEWSSGKQIRLCMSVYNYSRTTQPNWEGAQNGGATLSFGGPTITSTDDPDPSNSLKEGEIPRQSAVNGYLIFGDSTTGTAPSSSPQDVLSANLPLTLRMPHISLTRTSGTIGDFTVQTPADQFQSLNSGKTSRSAPACALGKQTDTLSNQLSE